MSSAFPNLNALWARVVSETLVRKGVAVAVVCPGSRSAPLAFAFAATEGIEAIPGLDERSAGFFALGIAKRSGRPVALVCTSGSAVANFFPAIVEASEIGASLILLTADRPPELRFCAAGQTIDQVKLFGGYVRFQQELAVPENSPLAYRYLRQSICHAVDRCEWPDPGPVHINVPLRDPLPPIRDPDFAPAASLEELVEGLATTAAPRSESPPDLRAFAEGSRGLILVGQNSPADGDAWARNLADFANALGWPLLADGLNPVRSRASAFETLIASYEFVLRNPGLRAALRPERVLVVGELPICKPLREWLADLDLPMLALTRRPRNVDPTHSRSRCVVFDFEGGSPPAERHARDEYLDTWLALDRKAAALLDNRMENESSRFEGKLAWTLARALPQGSALCVSNSMPPRDLEYYAGKSDRGLSVYASRGANGIDGILSTALGVAHRSAPTYLLIGDLALLHDTNGALLLRQWKGSLTILLVNNAGGGIFEMLPVAEFGEIFERYFATDQGVDFAQWAATYGIAHSRIADWQELETTLAQPTSGARILELATERKADSALRKRLFREIANALG